MNIEKIQKNHENTNLNFKHIMINYYMDQHDKILVIRNNPSMINLPDDNLKKDHYDKNLDKDKDRLNYIKTIAFSDIPQLVKTTQNTKYLAKLKSLQMKQMKNEAFNPLSMFKPTKNIGIYIILIIITNYSY